MVYIKWKDKKTVNIEVCGLDAERRSTIATEIFSSLSSLDVPISFLRSILVTTIESDSRDWFGTKTPFFRVISDNAKEKEQIIKALEPLGMEHF